MYGKWLKNNELIVFFVLAFVLSWAISIPLIISRLGIINYLPLWLHSLTAYGPLIAVFIVEGVYRGTGGIKAFISSLIRWKMGWRGFFAAFLSLIIIFVISVFITFLINGETVDWALLGQLDNLPKIGILGGLLFSVFNSGIGEEAGWRGFALPKLQGRNSAFRATIILGVIWAFWHLPFFFYVPSYMAWGVASFPGVILALVIGGFIFTWLYNSTKGNILAAALWHGTFDFITTTKGSPEMADFIICAIVIVWGIALPFIYKRDNLSKEKRQII